MDINKLMGEFQNINNKIEIYEKERMALLNKLKLIERENSKLEEKIKKEKDQLLKQLYKTKIVSNKIFVDDISTIFSFNKVVTKVIKNV